MKTCVVGLGYIGLPTALMLAAHGNEVVGVDYDSDRVAKLKKGEVPFREDGLRELFDLAKKNRIEFTCDYVSCGVYIVSVPTPYDPRTKRIDPQFVVDAVKSVLDVCPKNAIIVVESTISPGTIEKFVRPEIEKHGFSCGIDIHLAHAPERIIPGNMIYELEHNNRTIGADDPSIGEKVRTLYQSFCQGEIILTNIRTAEMTKVVENTYRDINIAFANELAQICRQSDLDVYEIIRIANKHPRVNILQPGPGVGGHCISVDPWFLVGDWPELTPLIHLARTINDGMPVYVLERISAVMRETGLKDISRVGLYGLSYKENVDDVRNSPTLQLLAYLHAHLGCAVKVYDPMIARDVVLGQYHDVGAFLRDVDMVVVMVGHNQLRELMTELTDKVVLDTRNVLKLDHVYRL